MSDAKVEAESFVGKEFDFCRSELACIELQGQRANDLQVRAQELVNEARALRQNAIAEVVGFALERVGAPLDAQVETKVKKGMPSGFKIVDRKPKASPPPPCEGKDCGEKPAKVARSAAKKA